MLSPKTGSLRDWTLANLYHRFGRENDLLILNTYLGGYILGLGLLRFPFFIAGAFDIIGLAGFYIFFVATKKYTAQIASLS